MSDLLELAERCEKAEGPDRELGREVLLACGWRKTQAGHFLGPIFLWSSPDWASSFDDDRFHRHDPTASIDAALTLVPDGTGHDPFWMLKASNPNNPSGCRAEIWAKDVSRPFRGKAATPALALCAAALRARAA